MGCDSCDSLHEQQLGSVRSAHNDEISYRHDGIPAHDKPIPRSQRREHAVTVDRNATGTAKKTPPTLRRTVVRGVPTPSAHHKG